MRVCLFRHSRLKRGTRYPTAQSSQTGPRACGTPSGPRYDRSDPAHWLGSSACRGRDGRPGRGTEGGGSGVSGLQRFEQQLEEMISGAFARAFRSAVQPVEIAAALQRECDNNAQILSRNRRMVPNDFHVELSGTDLDRLAPYDSAMAEELRHQLQEHADQQGYVFPGADLDRLRARRRPDHRPVPHPQPRPGLGHRQRQPHAGTPGPGAARGQRHPPPAQPPGPGDRPRHRCRRPDQRPRGQPPPRRVHRDRRAATDRGPRPRLDQRHARRRPPRHPDRPPDGSQVKIGNTTMTVHGRRGGRGCLS